MLDSLRQSDPGFPDGQNVKLLRFAYIAKIDSPDGAIHVATLDSVIPYMLSPRGQRTQLHYFDDTYTWLGQEQEWWFQGSNADPAYASGTLLFFRQEIGFIDSGESWEPEGNAIDFSDGYARRRIVRVASPGSWMPHGTIMRDDAETHNPEGCRTVNRPN